MQSKPRIGLVIIGDEILSGKRQDKHLVQANALLRPRGLAVGWVKMLSDEPTLLTHELKLSFASNDIVFCFGGIGATPDDRTRQCAADALGVPIERHPEAVKEIEAQFGEQAYPQRIRMGEYPKGARIVPNAYNRIPGFSIQNHYFMPGFPIMAKPMMEWILSTHPQLAYREATVEKGIKIFNGQESEWIDFMQQFEVQFPLLRLFSLPSVHADDSRTIDLGVEGLEDEAQQGYLVIVEEAKKRHASWEPLNSRDQ